MKLSLALSILLMLFAGGTHAHDLDHSGHPHLFSNCLPEVDPLAYRLIYGKAPNYPKKARQKSVEGTLVVELTIKEDGSVHNPTIIWSDTTDKIYPDIFHEAALKAVKEWRYQPAKDPFGKPLESKGILGQVSFLLEGYEDTLNLGNHDALFARLTEQLNRNKREKSINQINNILAENRLTKVQRASYLYLKAMYLYKGSSPEGEIKNLLIESKTNYETEEFMSVNGYKLHSFAGILLGQMYLNESDWNNAAFELETALRAAREASIQSERFFTTYIQLGIAHYNLQNWCEAYSSWDNAQNLGKKHGLSLPNDLKEPIKFAKSKSN